MVVRNMLNKYLYGSLKKVVFHKQILQKINQN